MEDKRETKKAKQSAFDKAVSILARRMRTEKQLRDSLAGAGSGTGAGVSAGTKPAGYAEKATVAIKSASHAEEEIGAAKSTGYTGAEIGTAKSTGYSDAEIDDAISRLKKIGYIDDAAYAERYLEILIEKKRGRRRIAEEMRRHGLCAALVDETISAGYSDDAEKENALYVARKKLEALDPDTEKRTKAQKLSSRLLSQGYGYDLVNYVVDTLI